MEGCLVTNNEKLATNFVVYASSIPGAPDYSMLQVDGFFIFAASAQAKHSVVEVSKDGRVIVGTGTYTYEGAFGKEALIRMNENLAAGSLGAIADKVFGNYTLIAISNGNVEAICDDFAVGRLFWTNEVEGFSLSTKLAWLAASIPDISSHIDRSAFREWSFLVNTVGDRTLFSRVTQLGGRQRIAWSQKGIEIKDFRPSPYRIDNFYGEAKLDEAARKFGQKMLEEVEALPEEWKSDVGLHQTGGLDSRTIFAAFMAAGIKPVSMYGIGNSDVTGTQPSDFQVVSQFRDVFNLHHYDMDWSTAVPHDVESWEESTFSYDFEGSTLYGGSRAFQLNYANPPHAKPLPSFLHTGLFGEALRLREWAYMRENSKSSYSVDEIIALHFLGPESSFPRGDVAKEFGGLKFVTEFTSRYSEELSRLGFGKDEVTHDDFPFVEWCLYRKPHAQFGNFLNNFSYSLNLFSTRDLHLWALQIPAEWRYNSRFQLEVIRFLFPEALDVSLFSHGTHIVLETKSIGPSQPEVGGAKPLQEEENVSALISKRVKLWLGFYPGGKTLFGAIRLIVLLGRGIRRKLDPLERRNRKIRRQAVSIARKLQIELRFDFERWAPPLSYLLPSLQTAYSINSLALKQAVTIRPRKEIS